MHGRIKVRTSEEEAARKKKEHELKVKAYRGCMTKIFEKRKTDEYDTEMMELTGKVLCANPDVYTLWNIRKECIINIAEKDKENSEIFEKDLGFIENCLFVNPKSYGAWYHRCWILENSPSPNWNKEVELCTKYLKLDERNFHCWDYRRYVVDKANVQPDKEFDFCTEKIQKNFSNYSSWHYRSKLLPILNPHEEDLTRPISEEKLKEELELVLTAAFTDPDDSSAWFYQRWLLGYSAPELDIAGFRINNKMAVISFSNPINLNDEKYSIQLNISNNLSVMKWIPSKEGCLYDTTWFLKDSFKINFDAPLFEISVLLNDKPKYTVGLTKFDQELIGIKTPKFGYEFGQAVKEELKGQLDSCNELLEYEPESKWTLLTASLLMRAVDRKEHHSKTVEFLKKLEEVDPMRKGYYQDLGSKWNLENKLDEWISSGSLDTGIDLSMLNLTSLYFEQYLCICNEINLSSNHLNNRSMGKLASFQFCKKLDLSGNKFNVLKTFPQLNKLQELILEGNPIPEAEKYLIPRGKSLQDIIF